MEGKVKRLGYRLSRLGEHQVLTNERPGGEEASPAHHTQSHYLATVCHRGRDRELPAGVGGCRDVDACLEITIAVDIDKHDGVFGKHITGRRVEYAIHIVIGKYTTAEGRRADRIGIL